MFRAVIVRVSLLCAIRERSRQFRSVSHAVRVSRALALSFHAARTAGLHHAHARANEIHSDRPHRPRPAGESPDRHRQNRGVRPADDRSAARRAAVSPSTTRKPRGLVLVPTRELALQVHKSLATYGVPANLRVTAIFGGVSIVPQKKELLRGTDIIVATPGRLLDHMEQRTVDLSGVQSVGARRSGPHARHGVPAAAATHPQGAAARSADAAVLGDH